MYIIHQTDSIVAVATVGTSNAKTGPMVQIWLLDARMHPVESRRSGADSQNQCEGCPLASGNGCYVSPNPLGAIWRAWQRGAYTPLDMGTPEWERFWMGADVRFGAYGNPSNLPLLMVEDIVRLSRRHTGYFHDWEILGAVGEEGDGAALVLAPDGWDVESRDTVRYRRNALVQATSLDVLRDLCGGKDPAECVDYIAEWVEDSVGEWVDGEIDLETAELRREESYRACEEQRDQRDELTSPRLEMLLEIFEKL